MTDYKKYDLVTFIGLNEKICLGCIIHDIISNAEHVYIEIVFGRMWTFTKFNSGIFGYDQKYTGKYTMFPNRTYIEKLEL